MKIVFPVILLVSLSVKAADYYVTQSGAGAQTGVDVANARSMDSINSGTNVVAGDTIHLSGTIVTNLTIGSSWCGTVGNSTTIKFETGAKFSRPTWGVISAYAYPAIDNGILYTNSVIQNYDQFAQVHDLTIDGGVNGIIECTSNGHGLTYTNNCAAIRFSPSANVEIKNLTIQNMSVYFGSDAYRPIYPYYTNLNGTTNFTPQDVYDHYPFDGCHCYYELPIYFKYPNAITRGVYVSGVMTNFSVHNCAIDHTGNGIDIGFSPGYSTNIQFYSNNITHCSWGIGFIGSGTGVIVRKSAIWANWIHAETNWNGNPNGNVADNNNHGDGILVNASGSGSTNYEMRMYRNQIGPDMGTNLTSFIWEESTWSANCWQDCVIYNNIFYNNPGTRAANGIIGVNGNGVKVLNNTFYSHTNLTTGAFPGITVGDGIGIAVAATDTLAHSPAFTNNIFYYVGALTGPWSYLHEKINSDYNYFVDVGQSIDPNPNAYEMVFYNLSGSSLWDGWTNAPQSNDLHGYYKTNEIMNATYTMTNAVSGKNLSADFTNDFYGNPRAFWQVGAIEATNTPPPVTYTLTLNPGGTTSSRTNGESVAVVCTNSGLFNGWSASAGSLTAAGNCSTTFTMPASDATVTASYTNASASLIKFVRVRLP